MLRLIDFVYSTGNEPVNFTSVQLVIEKNLAIAPNLNNPESAFDYSILLKI